MTTFIFCLILFIFSSGCTSSDKSFELKDGDLLFSVGSEGSSFTEAIKNSTSEISEIPYSHVGIVTIENNGIFVIEAVPDGGVVRTKLEDCFEDAASLENITFITVGRLKEDFNYTIPDAIKRASMQIGKEYDFLYDENNNSFYCSELVRFAFIDSSDNPIFEPLSMSFKNIESGLTEPFWIEHFEKLNATIPEGEPGTNPVDMIKSDKIDVVHSYF